jgi:FMN-dependent oxidoreductase (nitrilotriacetate monooxygenase family)
MSGTPRQMKMGMSIWRAGYHAAAWRLPGTAPGSLLDPRSCIELAQIAERGLLDMVFFADVASVEHAGSPNHAMHRQHLVAKHDPLVLMSALAMVTRSVGLVGTVSTSYSHPFTVARAFASLDSLSGGRSGWNLVTSYSASERANYGVTSVPEPKIRYERAYEFVKVVNGLWESWDDDAFVCDVADTMYFDPAKMHMLGHEGPHFTVRGPLDVARSPQGRPVIVTAGDSDAAQELAAAHAEVLYAAGPDIEGARAYYRAVKARVPRYGRDPDSLLIMPAMMPFVAPTRAEAQAKLDRLQALIHPEVGLGMLFKMFGDLRGCDVDGPLPDVATRQVDWARMDLAGEIMRKARAENLTIRQIYEIVGTGADWHLTPVGTPADIADLLQEWFETGAADGFNMLPAYTPGSATDFVDLVIPELQRRGLYRTAYESSTLRGNLGLARP